MKTGWRSATGGLGRFSALAVIAVSGLVALGPSAGATTTQSPQRAHITDVACSGHLPPGSVVGMAADPSGGGYWITSDAGQVVACGDAPAVGSLNESLAQPVVGIAAAPGGGGYWLVAADGGVFSFGDAAFYGSTGALHLNQPVVGMAPTPDGDGYWLVAADGGVFSFGNAGFYGSTGAMHLDQPVVGMSSDPETGGYWLVAKDGGVFAFHAPFEGSMGGVPLNRPVVGMAASADGYWLVAADGGIFSFGHAVFRGSTGSIVLDRPVVGMASDAATGGYWLVAADGGIFSFGAPFYGSVVPPALTMQVVLDRTRVVAGTTISGEVVLTNTTPGPVSVTYCPDIGLVEVGLMNSHIPFDPAISTVYCSDTIQLPPGPSDFPIHVITTYQSCVGTGAAAVPTPPSCTPSGPPPLPSGKYWTAVVSTSGLSPATPTGTPIAVTLLPATG
jgi:hypothetical protein